MITFFHKNGNAQATIDSDGIIKYCVTGDDFLLQLLQSEYSKGVPTLQEFTQTGIPGKIKGYQEVKETKDLITILKLVQEKYQNFNIIIEHEERKNPIKQKYTLLKWNGNYGYQAKFIVRNNWENTQSLFIPGRCPDLFWFHSDLANDKTVSNWEEFGEESFDELEPIAF